MLSIEQIQSRLKICNLETVSKGTALTSKTLRKIRDGESQPFYQTIKTLSDYFEKQER